MNATVESFLKYLRFERNLSWRTVDLYRRDLAQWERYVADGGRELDLASVTAGDIREWLMKRSAAGDVPGTLRHKVQALRALYRYLLRRGMVKSNPAAQVDLAKLPKPLPKFVREKTVDAVLYCTHHPEIEVVAERTLALSSTHTTGNTALNGLLADADNLSLNSLFVQGLCHLAKSRKRVAMFPWATVNQKYLCHISIPTFVNCECKYSEISPFLRNFANDFNKILHS